MQLYGAHERQDRANDVQEDDGLLRLMMASQAAYRQKLKGGSVSVMESRALLLPHLAQEVGGVFRIGAGSGGKAQGATKHVVSHTCSGCPWVSQVAYPCLAPLQVHIGIDKGTSSHTIVRVQADECKD